MGRKLSIMVTGVERKGEEWGLVARERAVKAGKKSCGSAVRLEGQRSGRCSSLSAACPVLVKMWLL